MKKNVLFSIVMPTRNRAALLKNSLQTALGQNFDDYEIIVCDNNSSDNTKEVIEQFKHPRLSYYVSSKTLSMPDNWEFAWNHPKGKYVLYLCDDDAYLPTTLSYLAENVIGKGLPIMSWDLASYTYPNWIDPKAQNILSIPALRSGIRIENTDSLKKDLCHFRCDRMWWPRLNNSCVEYSVLSQWRKKLGRLFFPLCPDYSLMNISFHVFNEIVIVERPLSVAGTSLNSIGASQVTIGENENAATFLKQFGDLELFKQCKSSLRLVPNMIAMTILNSNQALRTAGVPTTDVDWEACIINMSHALKEIRIHAPHFFDTHREPLLRDAARVSPTCFLRVKEVFSDEDKRKKTSPIEKIRSMIGRWIQSNEYLIRLETWIRYRGEPNRSFRRFRLDGTSTVMGGRIRVEGNRIGTKSILDMSKHLNAYFEKYQALRFKSVSDIFR